VAGPFGAHLLLGIAAMRLVAVAGLALLAGAVRVLAREAGVSPPAATWLAVWAARLPGRWPLTRAAGAVPRSGPGTWCGGWSRSRPRPGIAGCAAAGPGRPPASR
jgi:hypothetical protein